MKRAITIVVLSLLAVAGSAVHAHQPRVAGTATAVEVDAPEVSRAYYGELPGEPVIYIIRAAAPFKLYVGLLVPDLPGIGTELSAQIFRDHQPVATLEGANVEWTRMHEPYGGDDYLKGPEYSADAEAGLYEIYVFDPDNLGKYVVAIGEREEWPLSEMRGALKTLPALKKDFFGKSPWSLLRGRIGLYLLSVAVLVVIAGVAVFLIVRLALRRSARRSASGAQGR